MQRFSKLVLLMVASVTFVFGIVGAIIFFPSDGSQVNQARGESPQSQLTWQTSLAAGSAQAKEQHKYVLADVYTNWCGWCKKLDKDVFTNPKVVSYLAKRLHLRQSQRRRSLRKDKPWPRQITSTASIPALLSFRPMAR